MYWKVSEWERTKQEMQGKGMFNEMAKNVKRFSKKQTLSEEDMQWSLRMLLSKMQVEILQHRKSRRDSGSGKEPRSGRYTDASGCTGATPASETSHWEDALTERKKRDRGKTSVSHRWSSRGHGTKPVPAPSGTSSGCTEALGKITSPAVCPHEVTNCFSIWGCKGEVTNACTSFLWDFCGWYC